MYPMYPMYPNYISKTPTLQSLQDGSGRESGHIVLAGEKKILFLLLGSLSDFGINHEVDAKGTASID